MSRRSDKVALTTLIVGILGVTAWQGWRERNLQPLQRNRYASAADCACAYSDTQCQYDSRSGYVVGPWYARDAGTRRRDPQDPGTGRWCAAQSGGGGGGYHGSYGGYRGGPVGSEEGHRAGFGGTARRGAGG